MKLELLKLTWHTQIICFIGKANLNVKMEEKLSQRSMMMFVFIILVIIIIIIIIPIIIITAFIIFITFTELKLINNHSPQ